MSEQHTAAIRENVGHIARGCRSGRSHNPAIHEQAIAQALGALSRSLREQEDKIAALRWLFLRETGRKVSARDYMDARAATGREGTTEHRFPPPNDDYVMGPGDEVPRYAPEVAPGREGADE